MKKITYRFSVEIEMPLATSRHDPDYYTEEAATANERQRELERKVDHALRKVEGDASVELLDYRVEDDGRDDGRSKNDDDGREYASPRDYRDGLE